MIILPAERKLDWKHPPWMTLALMLTCLLVFLFYQAKDPRLMGQAINSYLNADLDELELPLYRDYLERLQLRGDAESGERLDYLHYLIEDDERAGVAITFINDRDQQKFFRIESLMGTEVPKIPLPEGFVGARQFEVVPGEIHCP